MSIAPAGIVDPQHGHVPRLDAVFDMGNGNLERVTISKFHVEVGTEFIK